MPSTETPAACGQELRSLIRCPLRISGYPAWMAQLRVKAWAPSPVWARSRATERRGHEKHAGKPRKRSRNTTAMTKRAPFEETAFAAGRENQIILELCWAGRRGLAGPETLRDGGPSSRLRRPPVLPPLSFCRTGPREAALEFLGALGRGRDEFNPSGPNAGRGGAARRELGGRA
ncbi:hypothetical protein BDY21DRAFT_85065 [Lineolata rhizophorae]|uniref:Uncharacterized protein n=1 Tax=Lineolata rhizophorae TaxID=578093 RepID=A0A6A6PC59_9PEZI|nr:hypothetical protein BDY21DRAFT_85065 [Lineolata rhizophorae]